MSGALLDLNVLLALAWKNHPKHRVAIHWFDHTLKGPWASCPFTQCGFVRISSNPRLAPTPCTAAESVGVLQDMQTKRPHLFWREGIELTGEPPFSMLKGHQQITDAYLLALAARRQGRLLTFDRGLAQLAAESGLEASLELIPAGPP